MRNKVSVSLKALPFYDVLAAPVTTSQLNRFQLRVEQANMTALIRDHIYQVLLRTAEDQPASLQVFLPTSQ